MIRVASLVSWLMITVFGVCLVVIAPRLWRCETHDTFLMQQDYNPTTSTLLTLFRDGQTITLEDATQPATKSTLHLSAVRSVALSPDGTRILTGADDGSVKLWNAATGQAIRTFAGHNGAIIEVAFLPDGKRIVSTSEDASMRVRDIATGRELHTFTAFSVPGGSVVLLSLAVSPDGNYIAGGGKDLVVLWDVQTGEKIREFTGPLYYIDSIAFSPDGKYMATGSAGMTRLWDVQTGQELHTFKDADIANPSLAFSPDSQQLLIGTGLTTLWDVDTGQKLHDFYVSFTTGGYVRYVSFSSDGNRVMTTYTNGITLWWEADSGRFSYPLCPLALGAAWQWVGYGLCLISLAFGMWRIVKPTSEAV